MREDTRLDSKDTVLARVEGDEDDRVRLDSWILDANLHWEMTDRDYWKGVFADAKAQAFMPGEGVHAEGWDGKPRERDELDMFWKRLVWSRELPLGEEPDPWVFGNGPEFKPRRYAAPRTHVRWIRALRFMVRTEAALLKAGTRRTLDDYPFLARNGLKVAIKLMTADLDYVDNIRFAETGKPGEMRRYNRAKNSGCCGSVDNYVIVGFKRYVVGCNYGH